MENGELKNNRRAATAQVPNIITALVTDYLPTSVKEMKALGWDYVDVVLFSGDAYLSLIHI